MYKTIILIIIVFIQFGVAHGASTDWVDQYKSSVESRKFTNRKLFFKHSSIDQEQYKVSKFKSRCDYIINKKYDAQSVYKNELKMRQTGYDLIDISLGYVLFKNKKYLDKAKDILIVATNNKWRFADDIGAADLALGIALSANWLSEYLSIGIKSQCQAVVLNHVQNFTQIIRLGKKYWTADELAPHSSACYLSLLVCNTLYPHPSEASSLSLSLAYWAKKLTLLPDDGSWRGGVSYWGSIVDRLIIFANSVESVTGDMGFVKNNRFFKNAIKFRTMNAYQADQVDSPYGDYRPGGFFPVRYLINSLARINGNVVVETYGPVGTQTHYYWKDILFYNTEVVFSNIVSEQEFFPDLGMLVHKDKEQFVIIKAGPSEGKKAYRLVKNISHVHPDQGHVSLYEKGKWILADDGYANKRSLNHNVPIINSVGQIGEGGRWFRYRRISDATSLSKPVLVGGATKVSVDLRPYYDNLTQLKSLKRSYFIFPDGAVVFMDSISAANDVQYEVNLNSELNMSLFDKVDHFELNGDQRTIKIFGAQQVAKNEGSCSSKLFPQCINYHVTTSGKSFVLKFLILPSNVTETQFHRNILSLNRL